jgi:hypothetical protein
MKTPFKIQFMLVVEVIELNRILEQILDLFEFMTLDATNCDVQLIYGSAEIS